MWASTCLSPVIPPPWAQGPHELPTSGVIIFIFPSEKWASWLNCEWDGRGGRPETGVSQVSSLKDWHTQTSSHCALVPNCLRAQCHSWPHHLGVNEGEEGKDQFRAIYSGSVGLCPAALGVGKGFFISASLSWGSEKKKNSPKEVKGGFFFNSPNPAVSLKGGAGGQWDPEWGSWQPPLPNCSSWRPGNEAKNP